MNKDVADAIQIELCMNPSDSYLTAHRSGAGVFDKAEELGIHYSGYIDLAAKGRQYETFWAHKAEELGSTYPAGQECLHMFKEVRDRRKHFFQTSIQQLYRGITGCLPEYITDKKSEMDPDTFIRVATEVVKICGFAPRNRESFELNLSRLESGEPTSVENKCYVALDMLTEFYPPEETKMFGKSTDKEKAESWISDVPTVYMAEGTPADALRSMRICFHHDPETGKLSSIGPEKSVLGEKEATWPQKTLPMNQLVDLYRLFLKMEEE